MRVKKKVCCDCGKVLTKDEIALSQQCGFASVE